MATYQYAPSHRRLEIVALVAGAAMLGTTVARVIRALALDEWPLAVALAALGLALADMISGIVHWAADTYGHPEMPVFGHFVRTFREHHADPQAITRHDFIETNGDVFIFSSPVYAVLLCWVTDPSALACIFGVFLGSYTNSQIHKWAHRKSPPRWLRSLQRLHVLLPADEHALHHRAQHQSHYCITTGWMNPLLDRLRVFRGIERLLQWCGVEPTRDAPLPSAAAASRDLDVYLAENRRFAEREAAR